MTAAADLVYYDDSDDPNKTLQFVQRMVEVDHGNGFATRYGHLSEIDVTVGHMLAAGDVIGKTGSSGRSTGPHLHYEVRHNGEAIDPLRFLAVGKKVAQYL